MASIASSPIVGLADAADLICVSAAAKMLGVSTATIRNMCRDNHLKDFRTVGGHRRLSKLAVLSLLNGGKVEIKSTKHCIIYCRVSSPRQAKLGKNEDSDLTRQVKRMEKKCGELYPNLKQIVFAEQSSAFNFERPKLTELLLSICKGQYNGSYLCAENFDRLSRIAKGIIETVCSAFDIQVVYVDQQNLTDDEQFTSDIISFITYYGAKTYSARGALNKRKPVPQDVIETGKKLLDSGVSGKLLREKLQSLGHNYTEWQCRKYILWNRDNLNSIIPKEENSAEEWRKLFIVQ